MGTSKTTNLDLIVPDINEHVPNQVQIFDSNYNPLDRTINAGALAGQEYIPILSSANSAAAAAYIGDTGIIVGQWMNLFDIVFCWGYMEFGDPNINLGDVNNWFAISLPVPASGIEVATPGDIQTGTVIGGARYWDNSVTANRQRGTAQLFDVNRMWFRTEEGLGSRAVWRDSPFVWADNDILAWSIRYRGNFA